MDDFFGYLIVFFMIFLLFRQIIRMMKNFNEIKKEKLNIARYIIMILGLTITAISYSLNITISFESFNLKHITSGNTSLMTTIDF